jgi:uncharacterized membrane protein YbjE (DUF340 family)
MNEFDKKHMKLLAIICVACLLLGQAIHIVVNKISFWESTFAMKFGLGWLSNLITPILLLIGIGVFLIIYSNNKNKN